MNNVNTRIRYKNVGGVLKSNNFITNEGGVSHVKIDPSCKQVQLLVEKNGIVNQSELEYRTLHEAKKLGKKMLTDAGVMFNEEIRPNRKSKQLNLEGQDNVVL